MITTQYQFPKITKDMHTKIQKWYRKHNDGKCACGYHGAIGGNIMFEITPTSIGDFLDVKCSCGAVLSFDEL